MTELYAALARAIARAAPVGKDAQNTFHKYRYASAESIIAESRDALAAEGLAVILVAYTLERREPDYFADLCGAYVVTHSSGQCLQCNTITPCIVERGKPHDKAVATALTYSLGYFLRGLLLLPRVDEEHDVDKRDDRKFAGKANGKPAAPANDDADDGVEAEALAAISDCATLDDLRRMGAQLASATLPAARKERLRQAYQTRKAALEKAA